MPAFLDRQRKRLKPRSLIETERHLMKHAKALHGQPVKAIDRRAVAKLLEGIERENGAAASNNVREVFQVCSLGRHTRVTSTPIRSL